MDCSYITGYFVITKSTLIGLGNCAMMFFAVSSITYMTIMNIKATHINYVQEKLGA